MNMDARSARINSEMGIVVRSPDIARQVTSLLDDISADGSYQLTLDEHGHVEWSSGEPGPRPSGTRIRRPLIGSAFCWASSRRSPGGTAVAQERGTESRARTPASPAQDAAVGRRDAAVTAAGTPGTP